MTELEILSATGRLRFQASYGFWRHSWHESAWNGYAAWFCARPCNRLELVSLAVALFEGGDAVPAHFGDSVQSACCLFHVRTKRLEHLLQPLFFATYDWHAVQRWRSRGGCCRSHDGSCVGCGGWCGVALFFSALFFWVSLLSVWYLRMFSIAEKCLLQERWDLKAS